MLSFAIFVHCVVVPRCENLTWMRYGHVGRFSVYPLSEESHKHILSQHHQPMVLSFSLAFIVLVRGHKATNTELAYTPVSQAYGHRHNSLLFCLATPQRKPEQCQMLP